MSDAEEPPTKVTRYEMSSQFLEGEVEEGQEEWLSEGVLTETDEDYNTTVEQDHTASNLDTSQDGTMASVDNSIEHHTDSQETSFEATDPNISAEVQISINEQNVSIMQNVSGDSPRLSVQVASGKIIIDGASMVEKTPSASATHITQDFEEALKNLEESQNNMSDLPEDLNAFLIRKKDGKIITSKLEVEDKQSDIEESPKHSDAEDDGNDTDGLLRVLGDDDENKKDQDSDDEFNFEGAHIKAVRVASNAVINQKPAPKAVPEDNEITDASSDEGEAVKKIFTAKKVNPATSTGPRTSHVQVKPMETSTPIKTYVGRRTLGTKVTSKPATSINTYPGVGKSVLGVSLTKPTFVKRSTVVEKSSATLVKVPSAVNVTKVNMGSKVTMGSKEPPAAKGPFHGIGTSKYNPRRSLLQPNATSINNPATKVKHEDAKVKTEYAKVKTEPAKIKTETAKVKTETAKVKTEVAKVKTEPVKVKTETVKVETEFAKEKTEKQAIMKPEIMDEEMPSDMESEDDEESLYDELPSSEDEGLSEWFTLDIRAERAGDYIPLLGDKAEKILLEEKRRVSSRLADLKKSLSALTETSRQQADQLSKASAELAELDAQINAA